MSDNATFQHEYDELEARMRAHLVRAIDFAYWVLMGLSFGLCCVLPFFVWGPTALVISLFLFVPLALVSYFLRGLLKDFGLDSLRLRALQAKMSSSPKSEPAASYSYDGPKTASRETGEHPLYDPRQYVGLFPQG